MNRIYLRHLDLLIKSDNQSRVFLAYMKIRNASKHKCGAFTLQELKTTLHTSDTTARKNLKKLLDYEYIVQINPTLYRIVGFTNFLGKNNHERFYKITDEQLFSYNWKNISSFRALLIELRIQQNRDARLAARKGFTVIDRHGVREKIKSQSDPAFDTLMAGSYVSKLTGKCEKTIFNYRKKQNLVTYTSRNIYKIKNSEQFNSIKQLGGKLLTHGNLLIYIEISRRPGRIKINGF